MAAKPKFMEPTIPSESEEMEPATPAEDEWETWGFVTEAPITSAFRRSTVDIEKAVPEPVRAILELSRLEYDQVLRDSEGRKIDAGETKYREVEFATEEKAKKFISLAKKWAKYRPEQCSVRAFIKANSNPPTVRFGALPLIVKGPKRLPGSAASDVGSSDVPVE